MNLILASGSIYRKKLLENAGLAFEVFPADIDEESLAADGMRRGDSPDVICAALARAKALEVSRKHTDALVIGADQMLYDDRAVRFKSPTPEVAVATLMALRGREHRLTSCVCAARDGKLLWEHADSATMTMRNFDESFARRYVDKIGDAALRCVGGYEYEGPGAWLFEKTQGDGFTIQGLPLVPLLNFLMKQGFGL
ncbi:MAG: Maf family protein [Rhodospirillales bacterium]|nr:Maf family protein [Rhodospirillales bacterium]